MRKQVLAAIALIALSAMAVRAETPQEQYKVAYEKAEAVNKKASELRNQWTVTAKALKDSKAAADAGDFEKALKLAKQAEALAQASIAQTEREKTAWKDAVIR